MSQNNDNDKGGSNCGKLNHEQASDSIFDKLSKLEIKTNTWSGKDNLN